MENPITCARCQKELPPDQFHRISEDSEAKRKYCRSCAKASDRKTRSSDHRSYLTNLVRKSRYQSKRRDIADFTITAELLHDLWVKQEGRCAISGVILTHHLDGSGRKDFNASIDRIDSSGNYEIGNVQLTCSAVNMMKSEMTNSQFVNFARKVVEHHADKMDDLENAIMAKTS